MDSLEVLEDRREALRQPSQELELEVTFENGFIGCATLRDLSRTGVRFRMSKWLNIHSFVTLRPPAGSGLDACKLKSCAAMRLMMEERKSMNLAHGSRN